MVYVLQSNMRSVLKATFGWRGGGGGGDCRDGTGGIRTLSSVAIPRQTETDTELKIETLRYLAIRERQTVDLQVFPGPFLFYKSYLSLHGSHLPPPPLPATTSPCSHSPSLLATTRPARRLGHVDSCSSCQEVGESPEGNRAHLSQMTGTCITKAGKAKF